MAHMRSIVNVHMNGARRKVNIMVDRSVKHNDIGALKQVYGR